VKNDYAAVVPAHFPLNIGTTPEDEFWGDGGRFNGVISPGVYGPNNDGTYGKYPGTRIASITDGTSNTIALAEKFVPIWAYNDWWFGDDKGAFHGFDNDTFRSTVNNPKYFPNNPIRDYNVPQDGTDWHAGFVFGSAHPSGINAVFADGSVQHIKYGVNPVTFTALGHRSDGSVLGEY
jgi:prepilin-type processing-associated H-X9-DG protein